MRTTVLATAGSLIGLFAIALSVCAAPQLEVEVGLSGRFVAEHFTPVRILASGIEAPFPGAFVLSQRVGTAWRGEAQSRIRVDYPILGNGRYDLLLPVYDATGPLSVTLRDEDDTVVASTEVDLRQGKQDAPFRVIVGDRGALPSGVAAAAVDDLPSRWLAYEGVSALWIARLPRPLAQSQWEAISRWVLAGGTLVLFSGLDFYLLDSPALRDLLPITRPTVDRTTELVEGAARSGARTLLAADGGSPLLLSYPYGFGTVLLAATSAASAPQALLEAVDANAPIAHLPSFSRESADLLEDMLLDHPDYTQAVLLVVSCLLGASLIIAHVERPRTRVFLVLGFAVFLSVSCGLVVNRANAYTNVYVSITSLSIKRSLGINVDSYALFVPRAGTIEIPLDAGTALLQAVPRDLREGRFDVAIESEGSVTLALRRGERRSLRSGGADAVPVTVHVPGDEQVEVRNDLAVCLQEAVLVVDGATYAIGTIPPGTSIHTLNQDASEEQAPSPVTGLQEVLAAARALEPLQHGTWLVAGSITERRDRNEVRRKVRVATLVVVEVVRDASAI